MLPGVVLAAIGCGALWSGLVTWLRTRGPRTAPDGGGPVPAAVLVALASRADTENPSVLNTTVFELAEAGVLSIEPADSTHPALVRPLAVPGADTLPPYQVAVMSRLLHRQGRSMRAVPLSALQPGEDPAARTWYREFIGKIRAEAAAHGLLRLKTASSIYVPLLAVGLICGGVVAAAVAHYVPRNAAVPVLVFINAAIISLASLHWATRMRLTRIGRRMLARPQEAAVRVASAAELLLQPAEARLPVAAPAPHTGVKVLPSQLQPLPPHLVWSDYGGAWHALNVGSRETYRHGGALDGYAPLTFFAFACLGGVISTFHAVHGRNVSLAVFAGLPVAVILTSLFNVLRRRRLPKRAVLLGQVAKLWSVKRNDSNNSDHFYCTLDVGRAPESVRLRVGRSVYRQLAVGALVEVTVNPRTKRIKDVRPAGGAYHGPSSAA
jgi:hypothetical protein